MNLYLLFKSLHLIAVISWMAGLLYLPRIFVYHSEADHVSQKKFLRRWKKNFKLHHDASNVTFVDIWPPIDPQFRF